MNLKLTAAENEARSLSEAGVPVAVYQTGADSFTVSYSPMYSGMLLSVWFNGHSDARHLPSFGIKVVLTLSVNVDDTPYRTAHGKLPRGRGSWAFCPANKWQHADYLDHVIWVYGHYAAAKRAAKEKAGSIGVRNLVLCS